MRKSLIAYTAITVIFFLPFGFSTKTAQEQSESATATPATPPPSPGTPPEHLFLEQIVFASTTPPVAVLEHPARTDTKIAEQAPTTVLPSVIADPELPSSLSIPSIGLETRIVGVGINDKGEMDVPDGKTNTVGWYEKGTVPGGVGSAVLDAHVYAAFADLHKLPVGSDIYVTTKGGKTLHFRVEEAVTAPVAAVSPDLLFNRRDARRLNLITCAGTYIPERETYDQRLVVYATYVGEIP